MSYADLCLVPQLYNARRFNVNLETYPRLLDIESPARVAGIQNGHPNQQPDAVIPDDGATLIGSHRTLSAALRFGRHGRGSPFDTLKGRL